MEIYRVFVRQGKGGKWRWFVYRCHTDTDEKTFWAMSRPYGSRREANDGASELLNGEWEWDD